MTGREISNWERVWATLRGLAVDRPAWSLWRHFYERESSAEALANAMLEWVRTYRFDLLKVNPRAHYHVEGWGARYAYSGQPHEKPRRLDHPVKTPADWERIQPLDPTSGAFGEQLDALRRIRDGLGVETPFLETVFSPLMVAGYLVGSDEQLLDDLREHPQAVHRALRAIAETLTLFAEACLRQGAAGIFLATTWATRQKLSPDEYAEFGRPYDLRVLTAVQGARLNVLHVCGEQILLFELSDYPVHAFSWATNSPGNPSLAAARQQVRGTLIGGLSHAAMTAGNPSLVEQEARVALAQTGARGWILGPSCSIPVSSKDANIRAAGRAIGVEGI